MTSVYLRDVDGTGSMHPCAKGDPGAVEFVPAILPTLREKIETDPLDPSREYIPLPGGWEIQTKGAGSSYRLANKNTKERHLILCADADHIRDFVTRMARDVHEAHYKEIDDLKLMLLILRDFVIRNATQWEEGAYSGHPVWRMLSETLNTSEEIHDGPLWKFIQSDNVMALEALIYEEREAWRKGFEKAEE